MICKNIRLSQDFNGPVVVSIELTNKTDVQALQQLTKAELLDVTIKKFRKKRSLDANSYMWVLLDKLSYELNTTKIELYRHAIINVGKFEVIPLRKEALIDFISAWEGQGIGNIAEHVRSSTMDGYEVIYAYYGSSTYNTAEMARLINFVVDECKDQGIETMTPEEIERMINAISKATKKEKESP